MQQLKPVLGNPPTFLVLVGKTRHETTSRIKNKYLFCHLVSCAVCVAGMADPAWLVYADKYLLLVFRDGFLLERHKYGDERGLLHCQKHCADEMERGRTLLSCLQPTGACFSTLLFQLFYKLRALSASKMKKTRLQTATCFFFSVHFFQAENLA